MMDAVDVIVHGLRSLLQRNPDVRLFAARVARSVVYVSTACARYSSATRTCSGARSAAVRSSTTRRAASAVSASHSCRGRAGADSRLQAIICCQVAIRNSRVKQDQTFETGAKTETNI